MKKALLLVLAAVMVLSLCACSGYTHRSIEQDAAAYFGSVTPTPAPAEATATPAPTESPAPTAEATEAPEKTEAPAATDTPAPTEAAAATEVPAPPASGEPSGDPPAKPAA